MAVFDDTKPWSEKLILFRDYLLWSDGRDPVPAKAPGETVSVEEAEPLRQECEHFLACCDQRRAPRTDGEEGLRVLRVLEAAQRSLEAQGSSTSLAEELEAGAAPYQVDPSARVDSGAEIGRGTQVWHFAHVCSGARVGQDCVLGQNTFVAGGVQLGNNVKVQNNVSIYSGVVAEDDVFLGPSSVLTNVTNPRSQVRRRALYEQTMIRRGATVGANATIVCGVELGRYCFVAAGAVVTKDVPDYALVRGVPAERVGWMSRHGHVLEPDAKGCCQCPESGFRYELDEGGRMRCLDCDENEPLPDHLAVGTDSYRAVQARNRSKE
jgi:UDP-2-acetamido-3-amino-2,3-dideoxy-glucuronate N-acetyltransferase